MVGLAVGVWAALRLAGGARRDAAASGVRDLTLEIEDLEARRDQIYRRLRGEGEEVTSAADRRALELAAARTLRQLDEKRTLLAPASRGGKKKRRKGRKSERKRAATESGVASAAAKPAVSAAVEKPVSEPVSSPPPTGGFAARHPLVAGFLLGSGMVAVVGVLIYWAVRDATPDSRGGMGSPVPAAQVAGGMPAEEAHQGLEELPITLAAELRALDERLAADPGDLDARRERALFHLGTERWVDAFEDAEALVAADPRDIDGLYVQGVVRLTMGQDDQALERFDQVLQLFPDHAQAMIWRGILLFRNGDSEAALAGWERALELAGGSHPDIEALIRTARETPAGAGPTPAQVPPPTTSSPPESPPARSIPAPPVAAGGYGIRLTIADGAFPPPGGVLFLSLRGSGGGPPVAVKRINRVAGFPLDVVIDAADSMMGQELPTTGIVRARLDADGSASTRSDDDLEAEVEARQGETVSLILGSG